MVNIEQLYRDFNITFVTQGHKHTREGWVNTECPFCSGNAGYHLGFNTDTDGYVCWRCGGHNIVKVVSKLLSVSITEAKGIIKLYGKRVRSVKKMTRKPLAKAFKYPSNIQELLPLHRKYLIKRDFDPDKLIKEWGIMATYLQGILDKIHYKYRIIIPIEWDGRVVSFDSRDVTNKQANKYQACPIDRELIEHKRILYGKQSKWGGTGICVEGYTDVWRMGFNSFSTSGIKYTFAQMKIMASNFKRVAVLYDNEPQANKQADKLMADLRFRNVDAFRIQVDTDPGDLSQEDADYLVKQIIN